MHRDALCYVRSEKPNGARYLIGIQARECALKKSGGILQAVCERVKPHHGH